MTSRYNLETWEFADLNSLQLYHRDGAVSMMNELQRPHDFTWHLKTFNNLWFCDVIELSAGRKLLDVGASVSPFPSYLNKKYGAEVWVLDKYDFEAQQTLLSELGTDEIEKAFPNVHFVHDYLGKEENPLPAKYFDVVYSLSVLEHFPFRMVHRALRQMDQALKPGGHMVHCIDIPVPLGVGTKLRAKFEDRKSQRIQQIADLPFGELIVKILRQLTDYPMAMIGAQYVGHSVSRLLATNQSPYLLTAPGWAKLFSNTFNIRNRALFRKTSLLRSCFDHDNLQEAPEYVFHRWPEFGEPKAYWPTMSLLVKMKKDATVDS